MFIKGHPRPVQHRVLEGSEPTIYRLRVGFSNNHTMSPGIVVEPQTVCMEKHVCLLDSSGIVYMLTTLSSYSHNLHKGG